MSFKKVLLLFHTLRHLRLIQIYYQAWYRIRRFWRQLIYFRYVLNIPKESVNLQLTPSIKKYTRFRGNTFTFLNQSKEYLFNKTGTLEINWNEQEYGKLWVYNLNYMDYILQPDLDISTANDLINKFIKKLQFNKIGLDPYPISLRGINWIKFFCENKINDNLYNSSLYAQYCILYDNLEYHLLGNHLLENGFSLLFGAYYFKDVKFFEKANQIIIAELNEQVLSDGGHFELSPMYHQIILDRLLDCINLVQNNPIFPAQKSLFSVMVIKAETMIQWLNAMTFNNGNIPLLNDSTCGISPTTYELNNYAVRLGLFNKEQLDNFLSNPYLLKSSGYRRFNKSSYECILDIGPIGPKYQPGHAHSDTFNFVLNIYNKPFIIETGISTYENNLIRINERSTRAHNTVFVNNQNSSQVWSSFRVGKRANVTILKDEDDYISAKHDGYINIGITHIRVWNFKEDIIIIHDYLEGKCITGIAVFIFHQALEPKKDSNIIKTKLGSLIFENFEYIDIFQIQIPDGYNNFSNSWKVETRFKYRLKTIVKC